MTEDKLSERLHNWLDVIGHRIEVIDNIFLTKILSDVESLEASLKDYKIRAETLEWCNADEPPTYGQEILKKLNSLESELETKNTALSELGISYDDLKMERDVLIDGLQELAEKWRSNANMGLQELSTGEAQQWWNIADDCQQTRYKDTLEKTDELEKVLGGDK